MEKICIFKAVAEAMNEEYFKPSDIASVLSILEDKIKGKLITNYASDCREEISKQLDKA